MRFFKAHKMLICIVIILVILAAFAVSMVFFHKNDDNTNTTADREETIDLEAYLIGIQAGIFDLDDYKTYIHQFRADYSVDPIDSAQAAAKAAIRDWGRFGYDVKKYPQPEVYYDSNADCWLVVSAPPNIEAKEGAVSVYETPIILIQADGAVLASWWK